MIRALAWNWSWSWGWNPLRPRSFTSFLLASFFCILSSQFDILYSQSPPFLPATPERPPNADPAQEFPYWSRPATFAATLGGYRGVTNVRIARDPRGVLHVIWEEYDSFSFVTLRYANNDPATRTSSGFSTPYTVATITGTFSPPPAYELVANIAVDSTGAAHVVWDGLSIVSPYSAPEAVYYRRRDPDPVIGWQDVQTVAAKGCDNCAYYRTPDVAVDAQGNVHLTYVKVTPGVGETNDVIAVLYQILGGGQIVIAQGEDSVNYIAAEDTFYSNPPLPLKIVVYDRPAPLSAIAHIVWTETLEETQSPLPPRAMHAAVGVSPAAPIFGAPETNSPDIALDSAGVPHFCAKIPGGIIYRSGAVEQVIADGARPKIAVDSRNHPHVGYLASISGQGATFNYLANVGNGWLPQTPLSIRFAPHQQFTRDLSMPFDFDCDLLASPNDQLLVGLTSADYAVTTRTVDADLGEQDAFATFDAGPNASANVANGNLFFTAPLFGSRGVGISTNFSLVYNSISFDPSFISQGWQHNYDIVLTDHNREDFGNSQCDFIGVRFGDGRVVEFRKSTGGLYLADNSPGGEDRLARYGHYSKVERNAVSPYRMTGKFGIEYHFDADGRLVRIVDTNDNDLTFEPQNAGTTPEGNVKRRLWKITDSAGRNTLLDYTPQGLLLQVTDPAARTYTLGYDNSNPYRPVLSTVSFNATATVNPSKPADTWTFIHHPVNDLPNGLRVNLLAHVRTPRGTVGDLTGVYGTDFRYYQDNRFARSIDPQLEPGTPYLTEGGAESVAPTFRTVTYANPPPAGAPLSDGNQAWEAVFTNRRGFSTKVDYEYFRCIATRVEDPAPFQNHIVRQFFPDRRNVQSIRDKRGQTTSFTYQSIGYVHDNLESVTRPKLDAEPTAPQIAYSYDSLSADPMVRNLSRVKTITDARGNLTTFDYTPEGNLKSILYPPVGEANPPCQQKYEYGPGSRGRVTLSTSPNGFTTKLKYEPQFTAAPDNVNVGLLTRVERPGAGGSTLKPEVMTYDAMGVMRNHYMPEQQTKPTVTVPDPRNLPKDVTDPTGARLTADYDGDYNLAKVTDPRQNAGEANGDTVYVYDRLNRQVETRVKDALGNTITATTRFDAEGNVRITTDFEQRTTRYFYDALNRLDRTERLDNDVVKLAMGFGYDANGNPISETEIGTEQRVTDRRYDNRNNLERVIHPATGAGESATRQVDLFEYDPNDNSTLAVHRSAPPGDVESPVPGAFVAGTHREFDARNRLKKTTILHQDPKSLAGIQGYTITYFYDCNGNVTSVKRAPGAPSGLGKASPAGAAAARFEAGAASASACDNTTEYRYDENDRLTRMIAPPVNGKSAEVEYRYNDNGNVTFVFADNPLGSGLVRVRELRYTDRHEVRQSLDALGNVVEMEYDKNGNLALRTDAEGFKSGFLYDNRNRLIETRAAKVVGIDPRTESDDLKYVKTSFEYDDNGNRTAVTAPRRFVDEQPAAPSRWIYDYDGLNRLKSVTGPAFTPVPCPCDNTVVDAAPHVETFEYDSFGNLEKHTEANGNETKYVYDTLHRPIAETHTTPTLATTLTRSWYDSNRLESIADNTTLIEYFYTGPSDAPQPANLLKKAQWTVNGVAFKNVQYTYTECGLRELVREPEGMYVRYGYDGADRLKTISRGADPVLMPEPLATYDYDKAGRRKSIAFDNGTEKTFAYDGKGRLLRMQLGITSDTANKGKILSSFHYQLYDKRDNLKTLYLDHKTATFSYGYDGLSRLVTENCSGSTNTPPDFVNAFATLSGGNESEQSNEACVIPAELNHQVPGYAASYFFDDAGNRYKKSDSRLGSGNASYDFDAENRLTVERVDTANPVPDGVIDKVRQYCYDKNGNRVARCDDADRLSGYTYDYANRLKSYMEWSYPPDPLPPVLADSYTYLYAPTGDRLFKTNASAMSTTAFMYDGRDVAADYLMPAENTYALSKAYVQGAGIDSKVLEISTTPGTPPRFFNVDALGSLHQLVDWPAPPLEASVAATQMTTAWGEDLFQPPDETIVTRYHFTQREREQESGLHYFRARHYDAGLGRFLQTDPILANRPFKHYGYGVNNPLRWMDPFGLDAELWPYEPPPWYVRWPRYAKGFLQFGDNSETLEGWSGYEAGEKFRAGVVAATVEQPALIIDDIQFGASGQKFFDNYSIPFQNMIARSSEGQNNWEVWGKANVEMHAMYWLLRFAPGRAFVGGYSAGGFGASAIEGDWYGMGSNAPGMLLLGEFMPRFRGEAFRLSAVDDPMAGSEIPFDIQKLRLIQRSLEKEGVTFVFGKEAEPILMAENARALYDPGLGGRPGRLYFREKPTRTEVVEELMHLGQHRRSGWARWTRKDRIALEIEAQYSLLRTGERLEWTSEEMAPILNALGLWRSMVSRGGVRRFSSPGWLKEGR